MGGKGPGTAAEKMTLPHQMGFAPQGFHPELRGVLMPGGVTTGPQSAAAAPTADLAPASPMTSGSATTTEGGATGATRPLGTNMVGNTNTAGTGRGIGALKTQT